MYMGNTINSEAKSIILDTNTDINSPLKSNCDLLQNNDTNTSFSIKDNESTDCAFDTKNLAPSEQNINNKMGKIIENEDDDEFEDKFNNLPTALDPSLEINKQLSNVSIISSGSDSPEQSDRSTPQSQVPSSHFAPASSVEEEDLGLVQIRINASDSSLKFRIPLKDRNREMFNRSIKPAPDFNRNLSSLLLRVIYPPKNTQFEASSHFPVKIGDVIAGRYQIMDYIGSAAFSKACQCLDLETREEVCVKIIRKRSDFEVGLIEIKVLSYLQSLDPNDDFHIVRLKDYFYFREHLFLVCELLKDNLYEFYNYNRKKEPELFFTLPRIQRICQQMLSALAFIHTNGLIHCDIKPENILVKSYSRCAVKLIDFGSSIYKNETLGFYVQSRSYRAPEILLGEIYDQKIDIWSFGCILAELFCGKVLFPNNSVQSLLSNIIGLCGMPPDRMIGNGRYTHNYMLKDRTIFYRDETDVKSDTVSILYPKHASLYSRTGCNDPYYLNFVACMLQIDPNSRLSAVELLKHPFLSVKYPSIEYMGYGHEEIGPLNLPSIQPYEKYMPRLNNEPKISEWIKNKYGIIIKENTSN